MNSIGSSPSSSGPPNETPKPSQDQQGLFSRIGQVVRNVFNRTTAPSTRNIDAALHTSQDSEAEASAGRNSPTPSTSASSPPSSRPSSPAPLTADSDASLKAAAMQATEKKKLEKMQKLSTINDIEMEFTIKMNGKVVVISPDILEQLSPILTELAKTPEGKEKLSKGFELVIDLDKVGSIQIYQNGSEILTDTCKTFFTTHPDLLKHIDNLLTAIKIAKFLNQPGSGKKTQPSKTTLSVAAAPADPYIVKVPPNGDCLLEAALYHITKKAEHEALTAQQIRREMIDKINNKRSLSDRDKRLILQDILDARIFAVEKNIQTQEPHSYLFSENAEGLDFLCADENITLNRTTEQWNTLLDAYAKYISHNLDGTATRPSLGGYAEAYLNQKYFQGKSLLVVTKESQGNTFTGNQQHTINDSTFPQNIPVILYDGSGHYDAIDSSTKEFWDKYKSHQT